MLSQHKSRLFYSFSSTYGTQQPALCQNLGTVSEGSRDVARGDEDQQITSPSLPALPTHSSNRTVVTKDRKQAEGNLRFQVKLFVLLWDLAGHWVSKCVSSFIVAVEKEGRELPSAIEAESQAKVGRPQKELWLCFPSRIMRERGDAWAQYRRMQVGGVRERMRPSHLLLAQFLTTCQRSQAVNTFIQWPPWWWEGE